MNKQRKTSHILNVFQYDADGHVVLPASLTLGIAPTGEDNSAKVPTTAWVRSIIGTTGASYVPTGRTITINGTSYDLSSNRSWSIDTGVLTASAGSGISVSVVSQNLNIVNTGLLTATSGSGISVSTVNQNLNIVNTGLLSATAGAGISLTVVGQNLNVVNTGVLTASAGAGISLSIVGGNLNVVNTITNNNQLTNGAGYITSSALTGYATETYVGTQISNLVDAAPGTLDTLNELAAALGDDPNFATTVSTSIGTKVPQARTITINGTSYDLTANRSWTINSMVYPSAGIALSTGTAWGTSITDNSANWNTAYGWGNHASAGYLASATAATTYVSLSGSYANPAWITSLGWSKITSTPTTISGYGITNAYTDAQIQNFFNGANAITGYNKSNWDTAYSWGNHAVAGYLTTASAASTYVSLTGSYANPSWITSLAYSKITGVPAFLTSYTETDTLASVTARGASTTTTLTITRTDITNIYVGNAIYFGGGNNYLNWTNSRIYSNVGIETAGTISASNFSGSSSGTNTGDQTNISGNSATTSQTNFSSLTVNSNVVLHAGNFSSYALRWNSTQAPANGLDNTGIVPNSVTLFDGYAAPVPGYPSGAAQWWVGALTIGDANRGFQIAGGYADSDMYFRKGNSTWTAWRKVWTDVNLTNLNQLTNGPGYITAESDTLASVTGRGASTSTTLNLDGRVNIGNSLTRPSALNSDSVAHARIGGSDVHLYVASLGAGGGYKVAVQAARTSDFASFDLDLQSNGGTLRYGGNEVATRTWVTSQSYLTGITSNQVTTALGYTPWNFGNIDAARNIVSGTNLDTDLENGGAYSSYGAGGTSWNAPFSYGGVIGFAFTSGIRAQFGFDIRHTASDYGDLWYRTKNNVGYSTWRTMLHSANYSSYALALSGGTITGTVTINGGAAHPLAVSSGQRYQLQIRNTNNSINSAYGWWWFTDTNFNMGFHADGASDRFTLTRDGNLSISGTLTASSGSSRFGNILVGSGTYKNTITPVDDANLNISTPSGAVYFDTIARATGSFRAPIFYDLDDPNYYVDPNSTSRLVQVNLGTANTRLTSNTYNGYVEFRSSTSNYLGVGVISNNGWGYIESFGNSNGLYLYTVAGGRYAFDNGDVTPYNDAENSLGNASYRWSQVYTSGWFRNYGAQGMYNQDYGTHFYSSASGSWNVTGSGGNVEIVFRSNHQSTIRGYVYADTGNNIGFLNNSGDWTLRCTSGRDVQIYGALTVGNSTSSDIYMTDTDETTRRIHTNSGRIGFLNTSGSWGAYCDNSGNWFSDHSMRAPIFYDSGDTNFYVDPNSTSVLAAVRTGLKAARGMNGYSGGSWIDDFANTPVSSMTFGEDKASGGPSGTWWFQVNMRHANTSNSWGTQLAYGWEDNANRILQRNVTGGNWSSWVEYLNSNNYGNWALPLSGGNITGRVEFQYAGDRYSQAWRNNTTGAYWWVTTDSDKLGFHRNGDADKFYFSNGGDFWSSTNGWLSTALSNKQNASTAITTSNIGSQSVNYAGSAGSAGTITGRSRGSFTVGGSTSTYYPVAFQIGSGATGEQGISVLQIERGGYDEPGYSSTGFGTFHCRIRAKADGWGYGASYVQVEANAYTIPMLAEISQQNQTSQLIVWLRGGQSYRWYDVEGGWSLNFSNASGTNYSTFNGNAVYSPTTTNTIGGNFKYQQGWGNNYISGRLTAGGGVTAQSQLICALHSSATPDYSNPLWIWANPDNDAIVIQNTTAGGTPPKIYFRDTNGTIQTSNTLIRLRTSNSDSLSAWLNGSTWNCSGDIVAYASDRRLKENITIIPDAITKVKQLSGVTFDWSQKAEQVGFLPKKKVDEVGVIAQEVQAVLPQAIEYAPFDRNDDGTSRSGEDFLTVKYEKIVPLLIEAIKEQQKQIEDLTNKIDLLTQNK